MVSGLVPEVTPVGRTTLYVNGQARTVEYPLERLVFTGRYLCDMLALRLHPETVQGFLPQGLMLPEACEATGVPAVLAFGYMRTVEGPVPLPGLNYIECLIVVPGCGLRGAPAGAYSGPFLFPARLYLDHLLPTILGLVAGYPKHWVGITTDNAGASDEAVQPPSKVHIGGEILHLPWNPSPDILDAQFASPSGSRWVPTTELPGFQELRELLNQPVYGVEPIDQAPLFSMMDFQTETATGMPLQATIDFIRPFLPPMPVGTWSWPAGPLHDGLEPRCAFRLQMDWQLAGTFDPAKLRLVS